MCHMATTSAEAATELRESFEAIRAGGNTPVTLVAEHGGLPEATIFWGEKVAVGQIVGPPTEE